MQPRCARALHCNTGFLLVMFSMAMFSESFSLFPSFTGFPPLSPLSLSLSLFLSLCLSLVSPPHSPMHFSPPWPFVVPHFLFVPSFFLSVPACIRVSLDFLSYDKNSFILCLCSLSLSLSPPISHAFSNLVFIILPLPNLSCQIDPKLVFIC